MKSTIKKLILIGFLLFLFWWLFAGGGIDAIKKRFIEKTTKTETSEETESKQLKKAPWAHVDKKVPKEFESGHMPDSKLKTQIKKITNKIKDEYGYKK